MCARPVGEVSKPVGGTLADRVTAELMQLVRGGAYPVNSRLPTEPQLAERFGVSRTVVREAISRLKSEGMVETRQGSGTVVLDPKRNTFRIDALGGELEARAVQEVRCGLESEMAALAAARCTDEQIARIQRALRRIDDAVADGGDGVAEDMAFHAAIAEAAQNPLLTSLLEFIGHALRDVITITRTHEARREDFFQQVNEEHAAIAQAIARRDIEGARRAALHHMQSSIQRLIAAESDEQGPAL
ncbi:MULTISPECIES: FadR/GntR family transcriptional regulator [unclassified Bordetella]|uniref:FadR/GntR family transcriptional regulator n=1 Tax=unclassified Bordetella TaxID=2630031 RepID=UPI0013286A35|nr:MULTISPECIES: FadR/GntR family transcriptional regulator [unclassified Bordetella]MVW70183.1 FCD domain-containing protein [Bordetella sp. 15P40C-2]MVW77317.1 FCD domain-containing protein [Bordetella sp. 02P26C-1]